MWSQLAVSRIDYSNHVEKIVNVRVQSSACLIDKDTFRIFNVSEFSSTILMIPNDEGKILIGLPRIFSLKNWTQHCRECIK